MKTCSKCKVSLSKSEFHVGKKSRDGLNPWCKACMKSYQHLAHKKNPRRYYERNKKWKSENSDHVRARDRKWCNENPERAREKARCSMQKFRDTHSSERVNPKPWHRMVDRAVRHGDLIRQPCVDCGEVKSDAHHWSYKEVNWLNVIWLCRIHHMEWHRNNAVETA